MIKLSCFCLVLLAIFTNPSYAAECTEREKACINSEGVATMYDCNSMCCGGAVYAKSEGGCCGNADQGELFDADTQICCVFYYDQSVKVHTKTEDGGYCCGTELITNSMTSSHACCQGWKQAEPFNYFSEMCCGGKRSEVADTAFGQCCGDVGFDRRNQSCPCGVAPIAEVPSDAAGCCAGVAYDRNTQFCCNNVIGSSSDSVCCGNSIVASSADVNATTACCELTSGEMAEYDTAAQVCCGGALSDVTEENSQCCGGVLAPASSGDGCCLNSDGVGVPFDSSTSVCCGGTVQEGDGCCGGVAFSTLEQVCCGDELGSGDACCGTVAFSTDGNVCCGGEISAGDKCCADVPYDSAFQTCCGDKISDLTSNIKQPSCCVGVLFDADVSTCCGATVHDNPVVDGAVSATTRCCGNIFKPETLVPYDYATQTCCAGAITPIAEECIIPEPEEGSAEE